MKRILFIFTSVFTILIGSHSVVHAQYEKVPTAKLEINGKAVNGIDPIKLEGTYYLPFVPLAKSLGYNDIKFEKNTLTYEVTDGSTKIRTTMGGSQAKKGNELVNIKPPRWINETAYISLHAGGALFNTYITFKAENGSIQIQKPAQQYIVHSGDSLWNIARLHHTTVDELKAANKLTSTIIKDGQVLKLPLKGTAKEIEPTREHEPIKNIAKTNVATQRQQVLQFAKKYIGAGYKFGATLKDAPKLFDCSSYTQLVFKETGIDLPRVSRDQASKGATVTNLEAGDLMFFTNKDLYSDGRIGHVGIYMGDGNMVHASTSAGVTITKNVLKNSYWGKNYLFSKRVIQ
ncbi:NlpC/P60 family protein [Metabacillus malikii]|uniref:Cell wall-associated NlpC family hydrolase n=1 Tax=Metabacillus malikii TaxID=1504265 RepID=A0ABT9ZHK4_9BACI|nr:NlpC/P60 family protein [Metabacillus malikii]MDQ0231752.1 cell wall-associated NlpC family hydrolase [Metabacillus malikii]